MYVVVLAFAHIAVIICCYSVFIKLTFTADEIVALESLSKISSCSISFIVLKCVP
jgi:hypothetical protein